MRHPSVLLSAALLLALAPQTRADDVIVNGGFETEGPGGPADSAAWTETFSGGIGSVSERTSAGPFAGGFAHHLKAVGANAIGGTGVIIQNSIADGGLPSLQGSTPLSATFRAKLNLGPGGVGFYNLKVLNGAGGVVAQTGLQVITASTAGAYVNFNMGSISVPAFGAAPNDVYAAFVEISVAAGAFPESSAEAFIDSVVVTGTLVAVTCPSDFDGDGFVTGDDFDLFVAAFEAGDISSDFDKDGFVTGDDFDAYVAAFESGC